MKSPSQPAQLRHFSNNDDDAAKRVTAAQVEAQHAALVRHKESLTAAMQELSTLRSVVKALEGTVAQLQTERNLLLEELRSSKQSEAELLEQISSLTQTCERLTETVQQSGVDGAHRVANLEALRRDQEAKLKHEIERLNAHLLSTQHPTHSARPIPWSKIAAMDSHPAHVLRDVVTTDAKREERALRTMDTTGGAGPGDAVDNLLQRLLMPMKAEDSEDLRAWLIVLRRIHDVLIDRRKLLHIETETAEEFLLRSRHELVSELVHFHAEVRRCVTLVAELHQRVDVLSRTTRREVTSDGVSTGSTVHYVEGHVELVAAALADMDYACSRVKRVMFTDVDRAIHSISG